MAKAKARQRGRAAGDTLAERAYSVIRGRILRGTYPLGAALSRRALATELGMSFLPISEALQRLEHDGLVESRPRAGTRVRVPAPEEIRERYQLREALETQAARLFADRAERKEKLEILRLAKHLDSLYAAYVTAPDNHKSHLAFQAAHMAFHLRLAELSGCCLLRVAIEREQVLIYNSLLDVAAGQRSLPPTFHADLAEALASGDVQTADSAMRKHVQYGMAGIIESIQPRQDHRWRSAGNWDR